jgi:hypothetical protein
MLRINNDWSISGNREGLLWIGCILSFLIGITMENMRSYLYIFILFMVYMSEISRHRNMQNILFIEWLTTTCCTVFGIFVRFYV